jgi:tetratricopeptide (TPR) repeat protein
VLSGRQAFRAGQYELALRNWQYVLVDNPKNGGVLLLVAQALFALGKYEAAASAIQTGMQMLPQNEWGNVVTNYSHVYSNIQNYKDQLKALENARNAKPDDPTMRFVLGYHFGYLGYPKHAIAELDKALDLQPKDLGSQNLRDIFAAQAGLPARPHTATEQAPPAGQAPSAASAPQQ